jgi:hypothetical protein
MWRFRLAVENTNGSAPFETEAKEKGGMVGSV